MALHIDCPQDYSVWLENKLLVEVDVSLIPCLKWYLAMGIGDCKVSMFPIPLLLGLVPIWSLHNYIVLQATLFHSGLDPPFLADILLLWIDTFFETNQSRCIDSNRNYLALGKHLILADTSSISIRADALVQIDSLLSLLIALVWVDILLLYIFLMPIVQK